MSARSLNKVMLIGNMTRDPELRYTPQGTAVCTLGIATNRRWTSSDSGDQKEETEFHRLVAWAKLAEICSQVLHKGRSVYVEGRLQTRKWTAQDGQERSTTEIVIDTMIALGPPRPGYESASRGSANTYQPASSAVVRNDVGGPATTQTASEVVGDEPKKKESVEVKKTKKDEPKVSPKEKSKDKVASKGKKAKEDVSEDDIPF